jgi:hypothetical protein
VRENLKIAQSRQKSYADNRWRDLEFEVGEYVYLKVSLLCGTIRFHVKGKLAPWFVGPYRICQRIGKLAYKLELLEELAGVHPVFHVSQLHKCLKLPEEKVPTEAWDIQDTLQYKEHPIQILGRAVKETRSTIFQCAGFSGATTLKEKLPWRKSQNFGCYTPTFSKSM